jgi:hypothetical protein
MDLGLDAVMTAGRPHGAPTFWKPEQQLRSHDERRLTPRRGQAMTEIGMIAPLVLMLLLGVVEVGLLFFSVGTARFAAGDGGRVLAEVANAWDADNQAIQAIQKTGVGQRGLVTVTDINIFKAANLGGTYQLDTTSSCNGTPGGCQNHYDITGALQNGTGSPCSPLPNCPPWPPSTRNVTNGSSDFVGVTLSYQYVWKSGSFINAPPITLTTTYYVRLEPQRS